MHELHEKPVACRGRHATRDRRRDADGKAVGVEVDGEARGRLPDAVAQARALLADDGDWGWPEQALPGYIQSHVHPRRSTRAAGEIVLLPTFRLPTLIHTRSGNAKWLNEISHRNPLWIHPARRRAARARRPATSCASRPRSATS